MTLLPAAESKTTGSARALGTKVVFTMKTRLMSTAIPLLLGATMINAQIEPRYPLTVPDEVVAIDEESARTWSIPLARPTRGRILFSWEARIDSLRASGHREFMRLTVNGKPVRARTDRRTVRLLNKPDRFERDDGEPYFWYRQDAEGWIVVFAPDFEGANRQSRYRYGGHAYDFTVDITDMLRPEGPNALTLRNLTTHAYVRKWRKGTPAPLLVRALALVADDQPAAATTDSAPVAQPGAALRFGARLEQGGGLILSLDDQTLRVVTRCSFPQGGWNQFAARQNASGDEADWRVAVNGQAARGQGRFYRIERRVTVATNRIDVEDRFENRSASEPLGLIVENRIAFDDAMPRDAWIGGSQNPSLNTLAVPQVPVLFAPTRGRGVAMVLQDTVFRVQGKMFYDAERQCIGARTDSLALDKGANYTLKWSIYAGATPDYFDCINRLRADWNVNTTINGPYAWHKARSLAHYPVERLRECLAESRVKVICVWSNPSGKETKAPPYVAIGAGGFDPDADANRGGHLAQIKAAVERVHEASPDTKVLLMTNCFLNSATADGDIERYADSWYRDPDGNLMPYQPGDARLYPTYLIYPTETNTWGRRFAEILDYYLEECGADGIYWDEMTGWGANRKKTYGQWDGHSADIDPDSKTIRRRFGFVSLLSESYRRQQCDRVRAKGRMVHANGSPEVPLLQTACASRMVETKFVPVRATELHLTTPLAYTYGVPDVLKIRERLEHGTLCFRSAINRPHPVMQRLFPFTPEQLQAGWIRARERIITCRSGAFGWDEPFEARVWRFAADGALAEPEPALQSVRGATLDVAVPDGGLVIIERTR